MWIGADPGGSTKIKFGVAILGDDGRFTTRCVSCADEAVEAVGSAKKPERVLLFIEPAAS
jgi:hypothetical protein